jgi:hypothetical protein
VSSCLVSPRDTCFSGTLTSLNGADTPRVGERVTKTGAATGTTTGIIIDVNYSKPGQPAFGPTQILIKSIDDAVFAAEGDSGSLIVSDSRKAVGLLWGTNTSGEGVASPIAPVLHAMTDRKERENPTLTCLLPFCAFCGSLWFKK